MPTDRQRRRRAKLARQAPHAPQSEPAPAHVVEAVRDAFGQALDEQAPHEPQRARQAAPAGRRAQKEQFSVTEAAGRLGVNRSTLYRRAAAGALTLTRQPYTRQLVVEREELERHAHRHRSARGRPPVLSDALLARIAAMRDEGMSLPAIGAQLEREGVPTAHGGVRWWPSAVQAALRRVGTS